MGNTSNYGKFLRDAIHYLIWTRDENMGDEYGRGAFPSEVPAFHYWVGGSDTNYAQFISVDDDTVTVNAAIGDKSESRALLIEQTDEGFVVCVPHAEGQDERTLSWQSFVADAINLYVGHGLGEFYFEGMSYGPLDALLRPISDAIEAGTIDSYEWDEVDDLRAIGDTMDDQDYAVVEYRLPRA